MYGLAATAAGAKLNWSEGLQTSCRNLTQRATVAPKREEPKREPKEEHPQHHSLASCGDLRATPLQLRVKS